MTKALNVLRLGDGKLSAWPWNPGDVVETQGMKPVGKKDFEANGIVAGKWACNAGKVAINGHPVDEACFVIAGNVTITDAAGGAQTFRAGDAFLLPRGFRGHWSNSDEFAKIFMAVERKGSVSSGLTGKGGQRGARQYRPPRRP